MGIKGVTDEFSYNFSTELEEVDNIDDFFHEFSLKYLQMYPESATLIGEFEGFEQIRQDDKLNYITKEFREKEIEFYENILEKLVAFDQSKLTTKQQINKDHLIWFLDAKIEGSEYMHLEYLVNQFTGVAISLPSFMERFHEVNSLEDAENYIIRLKAFQWKLEQLEEGIQSQKELGIVPPDFIVIQFRGAAHRLINIKPEQHSLYTTFVSKLELAKNITEDQKKQLKEEVLNVIEEVVYPAYKSLVDNTLTLSEASITSGIWELPQGEEYYEYLVKWHTTTDLTPQEVHDLGLTEVERILSEISQLRDKMFNEGVATNNQSKVLDKENIVQEYRQIIEEIESVMPELFNTLPVSPVLVEPVPKYRETTFSHHYVQPSRDGNRPGVFYVNTSYTHSRQNVEALAFHEALPGHHLQRAIQVEAGLPLFRDVTSFTAYSEGWALYAEKLMYEMGYYSDSLSELGYLESELFRAVRLVVDTGIHYKRWTKQEALNYMRETTGNTYEGEVNRYTAWPGQALAYKIGELKILELRDLAMEQLGADFDLKEFHDVVLLPGAVPLEVLEKEVMRYINEKK